MNFQHNLILRLLLTNPTMKEVFDHAIQYAHDKDPGFVKSYRWPMKTSEPSKEQSASPDLTRLHEQVSSDSSLLADGPLIITLIRQGLDESEEDDDDLRYHFYDDYEDEDPDYYDFYDGFEDDNGYDAYYSYTEEEIYNALRDYDDFDGEEDYDDADEDGFWGYEDFYLSADGCGDDS